MSQHYLGDANSLACQLVVGCAKGQGVTLRRNVVPILSDAMGSTDIACFGLEILVPKIERTAKGSAALDALYNCSWCSPIQADLLNGLRRQ